jgi:hypothetical protein
VGSNWDIRDASLRGINEVLMGPSVLMRKLMKRSNLTLS